MEKHPGHLIAIGGTYVTSWTINGAEYNRFVQYGVDQKRGTAFGIPIGRSNQIQFDDEVRLLCYDETETVTPDMWKGIVIAEKSLPYLIREAKKTNFSFDTPVFSTELELIAPSLRGLVEAS